MRPQSAFKAFLALLPTGNYSAEWSGLVQPAAKSNGRLARFFETVVQKTQEQNYEHCEAT